MVNSTLVFGAGLAALVLIVAPLLYLTYVGHVEDRREAAAEEDAG